jgi:hypothetical protein
MSYISSIGGKQKRRALREGPPQQALCEELLVSGVEFAAVLMSISDPDFNPDSGPEYGNPALDNQFQPSLAQHPEHMGSARATPYLPIAHSSRLASLIGA